MRRLLLLTLTAVLLVGAGAAAAVDAEGSAEDPSLPSPPATAVTESMVTTPEGVTLIAPTQYVCAGATPNERVPAVVVDCP